ncbi:UNVERIFIED_CONTAM: hypothetical protein Sangu_1665900 [Sesamum angustifolium]|uniref:Reverse transcriptase domain-containing protein n=1 Tax=Sesamum angustifolium TaxID=2727405 RepID=A0AAW2MI25_9LAMI
MLVNEAWLETWPGASYISALPSTSDHSPLVLNGTNRGTAMYEIVNKLKLLKAEFRRQRQIKGNLTENVKRAKGFLDKAQELFATYKEDILLHLVKCCRQHGDQNSKVFFRKVNSTRAKQRVFQIKKTTDEANQLVAPVTRSEIKAAFFDIDEDSAPGPDGYTSAFFRAAWPVVGQAISDAIGDFSEQLKSYLPVTINFIFHILNGSVYGFFKGRRGLRQGDPMSPYLFVLVMEIWSSLLRYRVKNAAQFQYHWKCKDVGLINLCFADDVLLFCKAHIPSIRVLTDTLSEFVHCLVSLSIQRKSQIILSRAVQQERQQIIDSLGFQEGVLPVKYLGVPLTSSRLTIADCRPLINKLDARLAGWNHQNLSYAGRVQLIKIVGWKKMVKLRPLLRSGLIYKVGNGSTFRLWQDIWHDQGPLCLSHPNGPTITGLPMNSPLSSVLQQNQWCWPSSTDAEIIDIISQLPPTNPTAPDTICWRNNSGKFTVASAVLLIQPATPRVQWHGLLQGKYKIARHGFILWLAILEKLSTMDKPWVSGTADGCVLCNGQFSETHDHLFFKCWFSNVV